MKQVHELVARQFDVAADTITNDTSLKAGGLQADAFDMLDLVMQIEDEFYIEISDDAAETIKTVGDLVALVQTEERKSA